MPDYDNMTKVNPRATLSGSNRNRFTRAIAQGVCPLCGSFVQPGRFLCDDQDCIAERERAEEERKSEWNEKIRNDRIRHAQAKTKRLFEISGLGRYRDTTFEQLDRVSGQRSNAEAFEAMELMAREISSKQPTRRVIVLCGATGVGKTSFACALINAIAQAGRTPAYCSVRHAADIWPQPSAGKAIEDLARERRDQLTKADLITIDDLTYLKGVGPITKARFVRWFNSDLDKIYNNPHRRMVMIFEGSAEDFRAFDAGPGTASAMSRLLELTSDQIIQITCPDWRKRIRSLVPES